MATVKQYGYQIHGNKLAIVEKDTSGSGGGLNFTFVENNDGSEDTPFGTNGTPVDISGGSSILKSPLTTVENGLEIEYVYCDFSNLIDEDSELDLPRYLSQAIVYYVTARIAEDTMDLERKEYFIREFRRMVEKYNNTRTPGPRMIMPGPSAI